MKADLETLKTHTFGEAGKDDKQTEHALTWLEIGAQQTPAERQGRESVGDIRDPFDRWAQRDRAFSKVALEKSAATATFAT